MCPGCSLLEVGDIDELVGGVHVHHTLPSVSEEAPRNFKDPGDLGGVEEEVVSSVAFVGVSSVLYMNRQKFNVFQNHIP